MGFNYLPRYQCCENTFFYILGGLASSLSSAKWLEDPVSSQVAFHLFD